MIKFVCMIFRKCLFNCFDSDIAIFVPYAVIAEVQLGNKKPPLSSGLTRGLQEVTVVG